MKAREEDPDCPACRGKETRRRVAPFRTNAWSAFLDGMERRINPQKFK